MERSAASAPQLAEWLEQNVPEGRTVFGLPRRHRRRLCTSNMPERLNEEIKRRTRVAGLLPNEASGRTGPDPSVAQADIRLCRPATFFMIRVCRLTGLR